MDDGDIRKLLHAARNNPQNQVNANLVTGWDYPHLSSVVSYCVDKGFIVAYEVTDMQSPFREFIVQRVTAMGEDFLKETAPLSQVKRKGKNVWIALVAVVGLIASLITIIDSHDLQNALRQLLERIAHLFR